MFAISKRDTILLCLITAFCVVNNFIWLTADTIPPAWDEAVYLIFSVQYYNLFKTVSQIAYRSALHTSSNGPHLFFLLPYFYDGFLHISPYRPPLLLLLPSAFYALFGLSKIVAEMTNSIFLVVLLLASYGVGRTLQDADAGLLASFLVSMYPELFSWSRYFMEDFALTAIVALGFFFFLKSDGFRGRPSSIAFGVALGAGMLIKWTYFVFMIGPVFLLACQSFFGIARSRKCGGGFRYKITNFGIAVAIGTMLASVWYLPNLGNIFGTLFWASFGKGASLYSGGGLLSLSSLSYHLFGLVEGMSLVFFLAFIIFTAYSYRAHVKNLSLLLLALVVPYAIFTMIVNKDARFMMPVLPLMAVMTAIGISRVPKQRLKAIVILLMVFVALWQYSAFTYRNVYLPQVSVGGLHLFAVETYFARPPSNEDWKIGLILSTVNDERALAGKTLTIGVLSDHPAINGDTLTYYAVERNYALVFLNCVYDPTSVYNGLNKFDYIMTKNGSAPSPFFPISVELQGFFLKHQDGFTLVQQISMPDESVVSIYRNVVKYYQDLGTMAAQHETTFQTEYSSGLPHDLRWTSSTYTVQCTHNTVLNLPATYMSDSQLPRGAPKHILTTMHRVFWRAIVSLNELSRTIPTS
jgi:4-amino-4-deoxy-L-arabinose transferase-like glycosyltransferase